MNKRGQFQLSFSMIFSIIIIIVTVAIAAYVIMYFLDLNKCREITGFYSDFQGRVDKAWASGFTSDTFEYALPREVEEVCFVNSSKRYNGAEFEKEYNDLRMYIDSYGEDANRNLFLYPLTNSCHGLSYFSLKHVSIENFFCIKTINGKSSIKISKGRADSLVKVS